MIRRSKRLVQAEQEEEGKKSETTEEVEGSDEEDGDEDEEEPGNEEGEGDEDEDEEEESDVNDEEDDDDDDDGVEEDEGVEDEDGGEKEGGDEAEAEDEGEKEGGEGDGDAEMADAEDGDPSKKVKANLKVANDQQPPPKKKMKATSDKENIVPKIITGVVLSLEEMVQSSILYLLLLHHKKLPIKRADVVKHAMNGQLKSFPEVMDKIKEIFDEKFGINLVGVEESRGRISGFSSYILVSKYPMAATECASTRSEDAETKRAILYLILAIIFMLGRHIEEDLVWKIFVDLQINTLVCKKRDDLRRFLKHEFVSSLYLNAEEVKETEQIFCRYSWGLRAEKEFSKYAMLKFVSKQFPEKKPYDFTVQYGIVMEQEKEVAEADRAELDAMGNIDDDDLDEDAPAQTISFSIDGRVDSVEMRGGDPSSIPSTLAGMTAASPASTVTEKETEEVADTVPETPAPVEQEEANEEEPMEEDEHESGSESEPEAEVEAGSDNGSDNNSGSGSDEAQEGSDAGSVSGSSSASGSESESEED